MGTLFVESLKKLEADMESNTRNPLSLLQLTMRFPSFFLFSPNCKTLNTCLLLRMVIRLKQSERELPVTLRQKLANEVKISFPKECI